MFYGEGLNKREEKEEINKRIEVVRDKIRKNAF
jgi:hypothetical protein